MYQRMKSHVSLFQGATGDQGFRGIAGPAGQRVSTISRTRIDFSGRFDKLRSSQVPSRHSIETNAVSILLC